MASIELLETYRGPNSALGATSAPCLVLFTKVKRPTDYLEFNGLVIRPDAWDKGIVCQVSGQTGQGCDETFCEAAFAACRDETFHHALSRIRTSNSVVTDQQLQSYFLAEPNYKRTLLSFYVTGRLSKESIEKLKYYGTDEIKSFISNLASHPQLKVQVL